jgi:hypothetical protein
MSAVAPKVEVEALATDSAGIMFGCTIHTFKPEYSLVRTTRFATRSDCKTHPDVIILPTSGKSVTLRRKVLLLTDSRTRFLERHRLEITRGDGFGVVPSDLKGTETHCRRELRRTKGEE